ncbi:hypothetical protein RHS03_03397, partial [Rhizoctonia solani]
MQISDIRMRLLIAAAVGAGVAIAVPVTIATFGFGPAGVAAGSAAAAWQSIAYGGLVPAGSVFAILQSIGATAGAAQLGVGLGGLAAFGVIVSDSA